jgi:hypothetical protein
MIKPRKPSGASMIAMAIFAACFILLPLGILGFELLRFSIAQQQLRGICDASALSGAVGIASTKSGWGPALAQTEGMKAAFTTFRQNEIVGQVLNAPGVCTAHYNDGFKPTDAGPHQCVVSYTLMDQNFTKVGTGDPAAKIVRCEAAYGYVPPIGGSLGFTKVAVVAFADGGLPQLDIVLAFDISGSMDDQTPVSYVKKYYDSAAGKTKYFTASIPRSIVGTIPRSAIYNVNYPPITGSSVNAVAPQNLNQAEFPYPLYNPGNRYPYHFADKLRCNGGGSEVGQPPGNFVDPSIDSSLGNPRNFTDVVVNLNGGDTFSSYTDSVTGLTFPDVDTLVEASRGNLENAALITSAAPGIPLSTWTSKGVNPQAGYQAAYRQLAENMCQPMGVARTAAGDFFNTLNISANCHFGLIAFSNGIGTSPSSTWQDLPNTTDSIVDKAYTKGGTAKQPLPLIRLVQAAATSNYADCVAACKTLVATGKTDIADSINEGVYQLSVTNNLTRKKARRAIVLFTDGMPNVPGGDAGNENSPAANAAYAAADNAAAIGVKIYAIGLSQNPNIKPIMNKILKKITVTKTQGQYILVDNPADLNAAFQTIAKALIVLREQ